MNNLHYKKRVIMNKIWTIFCIILMAFTHQITPRNPRRIPNIATPTIEIKSSDPEVAQSWLSIKTKNKDRSNKIYQLSNQFLRIKPLKEGFDQNYFNKNYIPQDEFIQYRNSHKLVHSKILQQLAEEVLEEIKVGQKTFTNFKILKCKDFNFKSLSGLLVLKYNDYPFVLKLSIEHPHTMIQPYSKSFESMCIFFLGGNIRHLSNFTRIANLENIKRILSFNPYYIKTIDFPRKWYWKPTRNYDLDITWKDSVHRKEEKIKIPSTYAVISDFVEIDESYSQQELNKVAMKVAIDTAFSIDPHAGNFVMDKHSKKIMMIDTENFSVMVGLDSTLNAKKYIGWYIEMASNGLRAYCGRNKADRIKHCYDL